MGATKYRVVCADPPWQFGDKLPGKTRGASRQYKTLSLHELIDFDLPPLADDCYLFLWRVAAMQVEAYWLAAAWGFNVKSEIVWQKLTKKGKPWFGMGRTVRASHETCLIATRGKPKPISRSERSIITAPVPIDSKRRYIHSAKPEAFYDKVERLARGPYVELFARRRRPGWTCLGDELKGAV